MRRRFPKGHVIEWMVPNVEKWEYELTSNKIDFCESEGKYHFKAFVAGDTEEKGISIVALDNISFCLLQESDFNKPTQEEINMWSLGYDNFLLKYEVVEGTPTCFYS